MENYCHPMACKETICTRCIHKNVCEYTSSYCNILEQIDCLDIPTPFTTTLTCKYLIRDIATRGDTCG